MNRAAPRTLPDLAACALAFEAEFDYVFRTLRRMGARPEEAQDLSQDVFVIMCRRWGEYQTDRPLRPWLVGIAHNVALDHFRRHSRREVASGSVEREDDAPKPDEQLASQRARHLVLRALAQLSDQHRTILIKHDVEGVPIREIAAESSLPFFTAAARLRRARLRFAKTVKGLQAGRRAALLGPAALLELERQVPPAPAAVRQRMQQWLRKVEAGGHPPTTTTATATATTTTTTATARRPPVTAVRVTIVGAAALVALLVWLRPARQPQPSAPVAEVPARAPAPAPAAARTGLLPRFSTTPAPADVEAPPAPRSTDPLAGGLIARWSFDDGSASTQARDSSGHGRHCLLHDLEPSAAWVKGMMGGALDLGRAGWLECPLPEGRAGVPVTMSVAAWIKRNRRFKGDAALFTRQLRPNGMDHLFWMGFRQDTLMVWSQAWTGWAGHPLPALDTWVHVAFVHHERSTRVYVDGALVRAHTGSRPRGEGVASGALTIGAARFQPDPLRVRQRFGGVVDEVRIYDRPLADAEIAALAAVERPAP